MIDCAAAGRVFGAPIGLPDWNKVFAMPGHQFAHSLDDELKEEMERVTNTINWNSLETPLDRTNNDMISLIDILATLDAWVRSRPAPKRTLLRRELVDKAGYATALWRARYARFAHRHPTASHRPPRSQKTPPA